MSSLRLYLSPYLEGDLAGFAPRADMLEEMRATAWNWEDGPPPGRTWTLMRPEGEKVGVAGLVDRGDGCFDAWALLAPLERRDWPSAMWLARRILDSAEQFMGAKKIEASARANLPGAARLLRKLGFRELYQDIDRRLEPPALLVFMQRAA
jgi:RimJ/RimL family protein N-acetyltransferase